MVYFTISAYLVNRYFNLLVVDKPVIINITNRGKHLKNNLWLVTLCVTAAVLHIYSTPVIVMGEMIFLRQTFWLYDFLNMHWHKLFDFPIQYFFWTLIAVMIVLIKQKKIINDTSSLITGKLSVCKSGKLAWLLAIFFVFGLFNIYAYIFPYYSWQESIDVIRFPPLSRILYLISYFALGLSDTGPRIVQLIFYILGTFYLYRTILLFSKKEVALLGATIYLFSPMLFFHATLASTGSGTTFFVVLISYYFLKFLKEENNRDLLLCTYFIGLGFLYKRVILVMFIICFTYLIFSKIRNRDWSSLLHFKILLLSLVPVIPWMKIGPGTYQTAWSHLISMDGLATYYMMLQSQFSWIVFSIFVAAFVFTLFKKRDDLSLFFGVLFVTYYGFFTLKEAGSVHRYSLVLYPAIHVFLARFIFSISKKIRWKYSFKMIYSVFTIYLIVICSIPSVSSDLVKYQYNDFEYQRYPFMQTTEWIKDNTRDDELILSLFMLEYDFYLRNVYLEKDAINLDRFRTYGYGYLDYISSSQSLRKYCDSHNISYVMFPYNPTSTFLKGETLQKVTDIIDQFEKNRDKEFIEVARFSLYDMHIIVFKPKENNHSDN